MPGDELHALFGTMRGTQAVIDEWARRFGPNAEAEGPVAVESRAAPIE
jgi:hypothetical protein